MREAGAWLAVRITPWLPPGFWYMAEVRWLLLLLFVFVFERDPDRDPVDQCGIELKE